MSKIRTMRVAWVSRQLSAAIASTRYRCYYPALALQQFNIESVFYRDSTSVRPDLSKIDALVFAKLLDSDSSNLAGMAKTRRIRVFIDLCDNVVVSNYSEKFGFEQIFRIASIAAIADGLVAPSPALIEALKPLIAPRLPTTVIPDQIETRQSFEAAISLEKEVVRIVDAREGARRPGRLMRRGRDLIARAISDPADFAARVRHRLGTASFTAKSGSKAAKGHAASGLRFSGFEKNSEHNRRISDATVVAPVSSQRKNVVWFGNAGAPHSDFGMLPLLLAGPALESVNRDIPLELTVISNNRALFNDAVAHIDVPCRYVDWSRHAVFSGLETADVCLLPFGTDPFSVTKSANRAVLALHHGVPVVTNRLSSMEPLAEAVVFDDWEAGLRRFLGEDAEREREAALAAARPILEAHYSEEAIGRAWSKLLFGPVRRLRAGYPDAVAPAEIAVVIQSPDVLDVLSRAIEELNAQKGVLLRVLVTPEALESSPRVTRALMERRIIPHAFQADLTSPGRDRILRNLEAIVVADPSVYQDDITSSLLKEASALKIPMIAFGADGFPLDQGALSNQQIAMVFDGLSSRSSDEGTDARTSMEFSIHS